VIPDLFPYAINAMPSVITQANRPSSINIISTSRTFRSPVSNYLSPRPMQNDKLIQDMIQACRELPQKIGKKNFSITEFVRNTQYTEYTITVKCKTTINYLKTQAGLPCTLRRKSKQVSADTTSYIKSRCLKCSNSFDSPIYRKNIPLKRICTPCSKANASVHVFLNE